MFVYVSNEMHLTVGQMVLMQEPPDNLDMHG